MAVDEAQPLDAGRHREVDRHRTQSSEMRRSAGERIPWLVGDDRRLRVGRPRRAPGVHGHPDEMRELPREVLDVHPGAAVDVRRVLAGEEGDFERLRL
jgi:hypothetical protein